MMECQLFNRFLVTMMVAAVAICFHGSSSAQENLIPGATNLVPGMTNTQGEEIVSRASGFSAVVTLDDNKLDALLRDGRVEVNIPVQLANSIDSVIIKRPIHFKEKNAVEFAVAEFAGRRLSVQVDDEVIQRIDYQPVELKVYEDGISSVVLRYVGISPKRKRLQDIGDPETDSPILTVKLKSGKGLAGRIRGMQSLEIESVLGQINVSFAKTEKILVGKKGELNIEMTNGDLISGTIKGGKIEMLNRWETETIDLASVEALIVERPKKKLVGRAAHAMQRSVQH